MRAVEKKLSELEKIIVNKLEYDGLENDRLELKDLSGGGSWKELYKTVCAFLNSGGGMVIIGVKEDSRTKKLKFTGYNQNDEARIKELARQFTGRNNKTVDLSSYVNPALMEIHPLLDGQVCVLYVEKLPEEEKFVYYNGRAYERQLSGDHVIGADKIKKQEELREELLSSKETETIGGSTIEDLDIRLVQEPGWFSNKSCRSPRLFMMRRIMDSDRRSAASLKTAFTYANAGSVRKAAGFVGRPCL